MYLQSRYEEARKRALRQIAYMDESNRSFAERHGGEAAIAGAEKQRFESIRSRLIELVAFDDAANEYIQALEEETENMRSEMRRLKSRLRDTDPNEIPPEPPMPRAEFLRIFVLGPDKPIPLQSLLHQKEAKRIAMQQYAIASQPYLFQCHSAH